ncbi:MAG TPA: FAD-linked oxidase C-terminal domain-containing protein [Geminicoccaceae bacterium]
MATTIRPPHTRVGDPLLAARLERALEGEVLFGAFDRGRYATDASIYQIGPIGVVRPRSHDDVLACLDIAREEGISVLPRGGGTSQAGQTVGRSLVIDHSRHLRNLLELDVEGRSCWVEPGIVLDELNRMLRPHGLFYPVDISTGSRATIGGMTGNNACGARSLRYGVMVDNVLEIEAVLASGERVRFGPVSANLAELNGGSYAGLVQDMRALAAREADEIRARTPRTARHVGGYNLHRIDPRGPHNMAGLLVGSEGTLAWFSRIRLKLSPLPTHKLLGVCHFPTFHAAMDAAQHIVELGPSAVELVDRSILDLARAIPAFARSLPKFVRGAPDSLLLVEFAGDDPARNRSGLRHLGELMADLGFPGAVVEAVEPALQSEIWELRQAGLNIAMSMKDAAKPVSFIEDCAVPLPHLAEYTARLNEVFARHGTSGTWYAHASVGCLHVRPILNLKLDQGAATMRAIAEEAIELVRACKGAHSGEHGDGLVRSEFHGLMFGSRLVGAFEEVKDRFDPGGLFNTSPSKIVRAPRMDERANFRFKPGYAALPVETGLDWSPWGGFLGAAEMCNNNGACRKMAGGVMCPSWRATRNERDVTRGRANSLRLALSGQLGPDALTSDEMLQTLDLCVACKACRRECPTGVDMARMKTEVLHQHRRRHGLPLKDRLIAYLPHIAHGARETRALLNLRNRLPGAAALGERLLGFSARRSLPTFQKPFRPPMTGRRTTGPEVLLFVDTFNRHFEPENARAAVRVLEAADYAVRFPDPRGERPLCCGRTFLAAGLLEQARAEARRTLESLKPFVERGVPVIGLEPSCLLTMRDEFLALLPGETDGLAGAAKLLSEFVAEERGAGRFTLDLEPVASRALVHGHCHEKAFGAFGSVLETLGLIPDLEAEAIESSCCGMAGAFGYEARHYDVSMAMAELSLLPAVRGADDATLLVADGTSCRHQIRDGSGREALHLARVLERALPSAT